MSLELSGWKAEFFLGQNRRNARAPFSSSAARAIIAVANLGMPEREGRVRFPVRRSRLALSLPPCGRTQRPCSGEARRGNPGLFLFRVRL
jgi:hypothetical protein